MTVRKVTCKSDHFKIITPSPSSLPGTAWCPSCNDAKLIVRKSDNINTFCPNCGELVPIKSVKFDTGLIPNGLWPQPTVILQPSDKSLWSRRPRSRPRNPIEAEIESKGPGYTIIDSDWRDQRL